MSRNFPQFSCNCLSLVPPGVGVGALCVPCAEVVLLEALGGLVAAPQFPAIFAFFPQSFAIGCDPP